MGINFIKIHRGEGGNFFCEKLKNLPQKVLFDMGGGGGFRVNINGRGWLLPSFSPGQLYVKDSTFKEKKKKRRKTFV